MDVYRIAECFDAYARTSGLLVLLDGLDEVPTAAYPKVRAAIDGLSGKHPLLLNIHQDFAIASIACDLIRFRPISYQ